MEDDARSVWLYLACGLVRIGWSELDAWASHPKQTIHATVFDRSDGVTSHRLSAGYNSVVAKSSDGKLWFVRNVGVSVIDPHHLAFNERPPPVHIERVTADDKIYDATNGLRLPARLRDLSIDYTALSLAAPEKVRFRYMLEGQDADWKEVVNDRQVQYSNLPPRAYRFRVVASNNSGVWNETGATLAFSIAPAYYQTRWFQALVVVAALCLMWAGYRGRVRQVARQYQRRLDERVNERTRIARELHDTLLQSFHGSAAAVPDRVVPAAGAPGRGERANWMVRLNTRRRRSPKAATRCRACGRRPSNATISRWRSGRLATNSRPTRAPTSRPTFSVAVEGETRDLHPIVRDEIYKIAAEALRNAFRHAHAGRVEVEIRYDNEQFRLRVRDDGKGIDRRCSKVPQTRVSRDTTDCAACRNVPH